VTDASRPTRCCDEGADGAAARPSREHRRRARFLLIACSTAVASALLGATADGGHALDAAARALGSVAVAAIAAGLALTAAARVAAQLLRPLIRAAIDPENLRVA
jgi:hypothetical protein